MNILVVNDDSINSPGIELLVEVMQNFGKVNVVAPHVQQSAIGHGITIHEPIKLHHREDVLSGIESWSLEGKPADCVKFALYALKLDVDLVVSGINDGPNLGTDIIYSGTLAGASEAIICGIPALAVSADFGSLDLPRKELLGYMERILSSDIISKDNVININFPDKSFTKSKGIRITEMGVRPFLHDFVEEDGVFWSRGEWGQFENGPETDVRAFEEGYLSVSPIQINRTNMDYLPVLENKLKKNPLA
jgi:5'-nucleotidase